MGTSTDAILVFGFALDEECEGSYNVPFMQGKDDFGELLFKIDYPGHKLDYDIIQNLTQECPAELVMHCSLDYPMWIMAVNHTRKEANRGYPQEIPSDYLVVSQERIDAFKEFCDKIEVAYQEPKWLLVSFKG